jgi:hypothetical protein
MLFDLEMEAMCYSAVSGSLKTTRRYSQEECTFNAAIIFGQCFTIRIVGHRRSHY